MPSLRFWLPVIFGATVAGGAACFVGACSSFAGDDSVGATQALWATMV